LLSAIERRPHPNEKEDHVTESNNFPTGDAYQAADQAAQQAREIGERFTGAGRVFGQLALDSYERGVATVVDLERKAADTAQVEWVRNAVGAHATFVQDLNAAYLKAARSVLD
jgi:hypothetical protein